MTALSFKSYRTPDEVRDKPDGHAPKGSDVVTSEMPATADTGSTSQSEPGVSRTRTLVLSPTKGLPEMIARGLARDEALEVRHREGALGDIDLSDPDLSTATDLIVFEVRPGNDSDLAALRHLKGDRKSVV